MISNIVFSSLCDSRSVCIYQLMVKYIVTSSKKKSHSLGLGRFSVGSSWRFGPVELSICKTPRKQNQEKSKNIRSYWRVFHSRHNQSVSLKYWKIHSIPWNETHSFFHIRFTDHVVFIMSAYFVYDEHLRGLHLLWVLKQMFTVWMKCGLFDFDELEINCFREFNVNVVHSISIGDPMRFVQQQHIDHSTVSFWSSEYAIWYFWCLCILLLSNVSEFPDIGIHFGPNAVWTVMN